jgi:hypothetical protein
MQGGGGSGNARVSYCLQKLKETFKYANTLKHGDYEQRTLFTTPMHCGRRFPGYNQRFGQTSFPRPA